MEAIPLAFSCTLGRTVGKEKTVKKYFLLYILSAILLTCASSSNKGNSAGTENNDLYIEGVVQTPRGTPVVEAIVRTMPESESVRTDSEGRFIISKGLRPGKYEFIAEYMGNQGVTTAGVQYGDAGNLLIKLGMRIDMETMDPGKDRDPNARGGEKRPGM